MAEYLKSPESDGAPQLSRVDDAVAGRLTELSIRVWSLAPELVSWSSGHAVICLMADLVTASGGQLVQESRQTLIARFDRQETAVATAKRVQRALQAFAEQTETAGLAASMAVHRPEDQVQSGTATSVSDSLWSNASVGQILVSGTVHETLQFVPGLQFRLSSADRQDPGSLYQELIWADAETLAAWQNRVDTASRSLGEESMGLGRDIEVADSEPGKEGRPAGLAAVGQDNEVQTSADGLLRGNRVWFAAGAICLALVAAIIAAMHVNARKMQDESQKAQINSAIDSRPIPHTDNAVATGRAPEKQHEAETKETGSKRVPPGATSSGHRPTRVTEGRPREYEGFTNKDIPQLLHKAEGDAGAGNYEDAKREYEIVLALDPGNSAARKGMQKLAMKSGDKR